MYLVNLFTLTLTLISDTVNGMVLLTVSIPTSCWRIFIKHEFSIWKASVCFCVLVANEDSWHEGISIFPCYKTGMLKRNNPEQIIFQVCLVLANLHQNQRVPQPAPVVACRCLLVVKIMQPQSRICHQGPLSISFCFSNKSIRVK